MNAPPPVVCTWDGLVFRPVPAATRLCQRSFAVDQRYPLVVQEERSAATHAHYFACINNAWQTLPDDIGSDFPSSEHLRKWALIKAGYCDQSRTVCESAGEARQLAALVRKLDGYAVITVMDRVVAVYTAHSQSLRAMGKKAFAESKEAVFRVIAELLDADPAQIGRAA